MKEQGIYEVTRCSYCTQPTESKHLTCSALISAPQQKKPSSFVLFCCVLPAIVFPIWKRLEYKKEIQRQTVLSFILVLVLVLLLVSTQG